MTQKFFYFALASLFIFSLQTSHSFAMPLDKEVTVQLPGTLGQTGTLLLKGTPGPIQDGSFDVLYVETDASGRPILGGIHNCLSTHAELNKPLNLAVGTYFLYYSNTDLLIQIRNHQTTVVELTKISLQSLPDISNVSFSVFKDLTDLSMQQLLLLEEAARIDSSSFSNLRDHSGDAAVRDIVSAWLSNDDAAIKRVIFTFGKDGSVKGQTIYTRGRAQQYRCIPDGRPDFYSLFDETIHIGPHGSVKGDQFISVLPGVYGIQIYDARSGQISSVFGVK